MSKFISICSLAFLLLQTGIASAQSAGYHILKTFSIKSSGKWDYLAINPVNQHLYVSHGTQVNIINTVNGDSVGVIPNTDGIHGIAFTKAYQKGFTSNGKKNTVTVFDINNNKVIEEIKSGENPDAIMFDPFSKKIFVCNGRSKNLTIIDPATDKVVATTELGGKPETAVSDEKGHIYINIEDKNEIVVLNANNFKVESHWPVGKGDEPSGLAIDQKTGRLFSGCGNSLLIVMDAATGKVVKELAIDEGCDGVAFDPSLNYIFSSNGVGTLSVIKEKTANDYEILAPVKTQKGAKTLVLDPQTHLVYLSTADFDVQKDAQGRPTMKDGTFKVLVVGKKS